MFVKVFHKAETVEQDHMLEICMRICIMDQRGI